MRQEGWRVDARSAIERVKKSRTTQKPRNPQRKMLKVFLRVLRVLRSTSYFFTSSKAFALRRLRSPALHGCRFGFARHPQLAANPFLNRLIDVRVLFQELLGVLATLAEP